MTTYRYKGPDQGRNGCIRRHPAYLTSSRPPASCGKPWPLSPGWRGTGEEESIFNRPIGLKIKEKELALICSQFAIILSAGMSIQHCVEMVAAQTRNRHIRQMLEKVAEEVGAGYSMAQSFENNAPYLPKTFIETVRAGEQSRHAGGVLPAAAPGTMINPPRPRPGGQAPPTRHGHLVAIVVFIIIIAVAVRPSTTSLPRWTPSCRSSPCAAGHQ